MSLLLFIGMVCNDNRVDDPQAIKMSQPEMAKTLFMSERTVRASLKALEDGGLIFRKATYWKDSGKRRWDTVFLNVNYKPKSEPPAESAGSEPAPKHKPKSEPPAESAALEGLPAEVAGYGHRQNLPVINNLATNLAKNSGTAEADPMRDTLDLGIPASTAETTAMEFEQWWDVYPKHAGRAHALRAFKASRKKISLKELIHWTETYRDFNKNTDPQFLQRPDKWLTGECWTDQELVDYIERRERERRLWSNTPATPRREPLPFDFEKNV